MALSRASHQKIYRTVGLKLVPTSIFLFCVFETYLFICDWEKLSGQCWQCPLHWTGNLLEKETNKMAFFVTGPSHLTANRKKSADQLEDEINRKKWAKGVRVQQRQEDRMVFGSGSRKYQMQHFHVRTLHRACSHSTQGLMVLLPPKKTVNINQSFEVMASL